MTHTHIRTRTTGLMVFFVREIFPFIRNKSFLDGIRPHVFGGYEEKKENVLVDYKW